MRTPPLLLGAALLFWGWQTGLTAVGALLAVALEGSRMIKARWEFSDEEFRRIWVFCNLVFLATLFYAFNANDGPAYFGKLFQDPNIAAQTHAGTAGARTVISVIRWSPMIFFLFIAAQAYSSRAELPLVIISLFLWRRRKKALKAGRPLPDSKQFNTSYPFFGMCLLAASNHAKETWGFFAGFCFLMAWALWPYRSRRLSPVIWLAVLVFAMESGYLGQGGLNRLSNSSAQWLAEFFQPRTNPYQNTTALGQIGRVSGSGRIVIRLETKPGASPPIYLREASYRRYRAPAWFAGSGKGGFDLIEPDRTNGLAWTLVPQKENDHSVNIACYLAGGRALLPLPSGCGRLENLPAYILSGNSEGAVLAEGPGLVIFDALYGPGATMDSPAGTNDLEVPMEEAPALQQIVQELEISGLPLQKKLQKLQGFFQGEFTYSTWQEPPRRKDTNTTALSRFLLKTHSGHCEYFATATVLLLREMHIPARYAIGYAVHEASLGNKYVVRQRDGHAWCLVWDDATKTWFDFDTTPASWIAEEGKRASPFQFLSDFWTRIKFEISRFRWGQSEIRQYILWGLIPVLALLFYQIIFRKSWRRRTKKSSRAGVLVDWPGLDSEFYQLERRLVKFIGERRPDETLENWLERAAREPALAGTADAMRELLRLHYRYRFDPLGLDATERQALKQAVDKCLQNLTAGEPVRG